MLHTNLFWVLGLFCTLTTTHPTAFSPHNAVANGVDLRILPFGDSITIGQSSTDHNGYRLELLDKLRPTNKVEYVGHLKTGTMKNNAHQGYQGFDIGLILEKAMPDFSWRPNVVLLMLGTNNIVREVDYAHAPQLLTDLIGVVVNACPDAAILVSEITPVRRPDYDAQRLEYNAAIPGIVGKFADQGKKVAVVKMTGVGHEHINDWDKVHPTDAGYKIIAQNWYNAIADAGRKGWIERPMTETTWVSEDPAPQVEIVPVIKGISDAPPNQPVKPASDFPPSNPPSAPLKSTEQHQHIAPQPPLPQQDAPSSPHQELQFPPTSRKQGEAVLGQGGSPKNQPGSPRLAISSYTKGSNLHQLSIFSLVLFIVLILLSARRRSLRLWR